MTKTTLGLFVLATSAGVMMLDAPRAEACGGCFVPQTESTVVTDHRMALSISTQQTVLWDQIRYSGDPREFAWVLPVRNGAKLELANDEFFNALDRSTQPVVVQPNNFGGAAGCALTGCSSSEALSASDTAGPGEVQVLNQSVVGPYETVTLRATDDDALTLWLKKNSFTIPASIEPTISAYVSEGFDFIALRLRPQCSERSMQPVRVVTPGADPTLPLRMVAAGIGAKVGITLYVISEGRYEPQNFPHELIDDADLRWDRFQGKSNYQTLSEDTMSQANGFTWITEYANNPQLPPAIGRWTPSSATNGSFVGGRFTPGLTDAYYQQCKAYRGSAGSSSGSVANPNNTTPPITPCPDAKDAGNQTQQPGEDAGVKDSGASTDAASSDGGGQKIDAGSDPIDPDPDPDPTPDSGSKPSSGDPCAYLDDLDVALNGLHRQNIWVTRMRSILPVDALKTGDLRLQASKEQKVVSHVHYARYYTDDDAPSRSSTRDGCGSAPKEHRAYGSWVIACLSAVFGIAAIRRRRKR
jgi:hypothetical protein